ncbi:MAG TPA: lytic transglycosylase domain-containing protein [Gallionellaceae bacterium]
MRLTLKRHPQHLALPLLLAAGLLSAPAAYGGAQVYSPLSASVRTLLQQSISDQAAPRLVFKSEPEGQAWLAEMSRRLEKHMPDEQERRNFLISVQYEAARAGLDPQMVLGLIEVESRFHKYAVSRAGARGYMQVMPFWVKQIGSQGQNLFHLRTNLRYGCTILRHYLDIEKGNLTRALARYNGSLGKREYPTRVKYAWQKHWSLPSKMAVVEGGAAG